MLEFKTVILGLV